LIAKTKENDVGTQVSGGIEKNQELLRLLHFVTREQTKNIKMAKNDAIPTRSPETGIAPQSS